MKRKDIYIKIVDKVFKINTDSQEWYRIYTYYFEKMLVSPTDNLVTSIQDGEGIKGRRRIFSLIKLVIENLKEDFLFFHASGLEKGGKALIFVGPADSGKTTAFLYGMMRGYKGLSDDILLYSTKDGYVYSFPFKLRHYPMLPHFEKIFGKVIQFQYVERAKLEKIFLLKEASANASGKISFLFQNCYNSYLEKDRTYIEIVNLVSKKGFQIEFISPLNIFENFDQTNSLLSEIFKGTTDA